MNVLIVLDAKLPVYAYGGTERVMWYLAKELAAMKHKVTLLAREGSQCDFAKVLTYRHDRSVNEQIPTDIDIVHFNGGDCAGFTAKPYVVTIHGNGGRGELDRNSIFVSRNHAERFGSDQFVYNGLDWDDYGSINANQVRSDFHFLGNAAWRVKNVKGAIDVVKSLPGGRLNVFGGSRFNLKMGVRFTLTPRARFYGMVGGEEKLRLLKQSRGLVFPVVWDEPFGLAVTESLFCGAPVFATPFGSFPELVTPEVGFLTADKQMMIHHIRDDYHYSSQRCHEYAADLFNSRVMAEAYLQKYEQVLDGKTLNVRTPHPITPDTRYSFK